MSGREGSGPWRVRWRRATWWSPSYRRFATQLEAWEFVEEKLLGEAPEDHPEWDGLPEFDRLEIDGPDGTRVDVLAGEPMKARYP